MRGGNLAPGPPPALRSLAAVVVVLAACAVLLMLPGAALAASPEPFGHACAPENGVLFCPTVDLDDRVESFDEDPTAQGETRAPLDVDVTLPAGYDTDQGALPTIVMMHGYGGDKTAFQSDTPQSTSSTNFHYNDNFFAKQGYAVVTYSARGFGRSCGSVESASTPECQETRSYVHLADKRWEARDTQHLLGLLVDQDITDPDAIGVTGISYGGGQSIELAYLNDRIRTLDGRFEAWESRDGEPLEIAAAFPRWPWSDLVNSLVPNGRFLDSRVSPPDESRDPFGIPKQSYINGLFALGAATGTYCGEPPRTPPCDDDTADLTRWFPRILLGEPFDQEARDIANEIYANHQGYGTKVGPDGVAPLLLQSGWTDDLFPVRESIRVYNAVRADDPDASVAMQFGDLGHPRASNKENSDRAFNDAGAEFFERELGGGGAPDDAPAASQPGAVTAYTQTCPTDAPADGPFRAPSYDRLGRGTLRFSGSSPETVSSGGNPATGVAVDALTGSACDEVPEENVPGTAVVEGEVSRGFTLLGLPTVTARIDATGPFGQLDSRLWDIAPDGQQTLVSRGVYRLEPNQDGRVRFQLNGNGYCFANGHVPKLELLNSDAPSFRPSNVPSTIDVRNVDVSLPTAERNPRPRLDLSVTPRQTRVGEPTQFRFTVTSREGECATADDEQPDSGVPVENARIRFGGENGRTNDDGRLTLRGRFSEAGRTTARATRPGYRADEEQVRVLAAEGVGSGPDDGDDGGGSDDVGTQGDGGSGTGAASGDLDGVDVDCPDVTQDEAQTLLDADPSDPFRLDADDDGTACDLGAGGASDSGDLPFTGLGLGLLLLVGSVLAASGAAARRRLRARSA